MRIEVLIFGTAAAAARSDRVTVHVSARRGEDRPVRAADVLEAIAEQHPILKFALPTARLAVNQKMATPVTDVRASDEIALIALVGGG